MTKSSTICLLASVLVIGWLLLRDRPEQPDNQIQTHQAKIDSLNKAWADSLYRQEIRSLAVFQEYVRKLDKQEGETAYWINETKKERAFNRRFTLHQQDSLLSRITN